MEYRPLLGQEPSRKHCLCLFYNVDRNAPLADDREILQNSMWVSVYGILRRVSDNQQCPGTGPLLMGNADQKTEQGFRSEIFESAVQRVLGTAAQNFPPGSNQSHVALQKS